MFNGYSSLQVLNFADECSVSLINDEFNDCTSLKKIYWGKNCGIKEITESFQRCGELEKLSIPSSVETIGEKSFSNCLKLSSLTFASGSKLKTIGKEAFAFLEKEYIFTPSTIASLTLPASLETLEEGAFHCIPVKKFALQDNSKLTEIPDGFLAADGEDGKPGVQTECNKIWDYVIKWFKELSEPYPYTPEAVAKLCDCLESIDFGDNNALTRIGMGAFKNQTHLTTLDFGVGSTAELTIARGAFIAVGNNGYTTVDGKLGGIDTVVFPANLVEMDGSAFGSARIKNIKFSDNCKLQVIDSAFMEISGAGHNGKPGANGDGSFNNDPVKLAANSLKTVYFGKNNSLNRICGGTFKNQSHMISINFGTSTVESLIIDYGAFVGVGNNGYLYEQGVDQTLNPGIATLTFPANLTSMSEGAFQMARIQKLVFSKNCKLDRIPNAFMAIDEAGCNGYPSKGYKYNPDTGYSEDCFNNDYAQIAANSLQSVDFGANNSLMEIGSGAFKNQSHMTAINFGTSTVDLTIDYGAFIGVGNNGFYVSGGVDQTLCAGIETLVFPANLTAIDVGAFDMAKVKNIVFSDNCKLESIPKGFLGIDGNGNNGYPGKTSRYNPDTGYSEDCFNNDYAQIAANSLQSVDFGANNSLMEIGSGAFKNQSHVTAINFGTSTVDLTIDYGAFIGVGNNGYYVSEGADQTLCAGIETLVFPANLTTMKAGAFDMAQVKNIVFSDNCKLDSIPNNFMGITGTGCNGYPGKNYGYDEDGIYKEMLKYDLAQIANLSLKTIDFGENNSLGRIGAGAFRNQVHVTSIDFGTSTVDLTINGSAFVGVGNNGYYVAEGVDQTLCAGIETLVFPANLTEMNPGAFEMAQVKNIVFSDNCKLSEIPSNFMGSIGTGCNGCPGKGSTFVYDLAQFTSLSLKTVSFGKNNNLSIINSAAFKNQIHMTNIDFGTSSAESLVLRYGAFIGVGNNAYLVENNVDSVLNEGIETLTLPANLVRMDEGSFDFARIKHIVFSDDCMLERIPNGFMQIGGKLGNASTEAVRVGANCLESVDFGKNNSLTEIGYGAFHYQSYLTDITFGKNKDASKLIIDDGAFQGIKYMETLVLDENCQATELAGGVFSSSQFVTTINMRKSNITLIDDSMKNNYNLSCIIFPEGLKKITWSGYVAPEDIKPEDYDVDTVEEAMQIIYELCPFYGCDNVQKLVFASTDPSVYTFDDNVLQFLNSSGVVCVPEGTSEVAIEQYKVLLTKAGLPFGEGKWTVEPTPYHELRVVKAVAPTCTTDGNSKYYRCIDEGCDTYYENGGLWEEIEKGSWVLPKLGHVKVNDNAFAATTISDGKTAGSHCSRCDYVFVAQKTIPMISTVKLSPASYTYSGKAKSPKLYVKDRTGKSLVKNTDYKYTTPKGRTNVGKYTYKVTFKGKYSGTKSVSFTINPKGTSITKLTAASKGFTVAWKKQTTQTTGYQVQIATNSSYTKGAKTYTVSKNKTTSLKITKLSSKKKYYVRVRTYKTVSGKKYYSSWSAKKTVTTK